MCQRLVEIHSDLTKCETIKCAEIQNFSFLQSKKRSITDLLQTNKKVFLQSLFAIQQLFSLCLHIVVIEYIEKLCIPGCD